MEIHAVIIDDDDDDDDDDHVIHCSDITTFLFTRRFNL